MIVCIFIHLQTNEYTILSLDMKPIVAIIVFFSLKCGKGFQVVSDAQGDVENGKVVRCHRLHQRNDREPSDEERGYQVQWQDLFRRAQTEV